MLSIMITMILGLAALGFSLFGCRLMHKMNGYKPLIFTSIGQILGFITIVIILNNLPS